MVVMDGQRTTLLVLDSIKCLPWLKTKSCKSRKIININNCSLNKSKVKAILLSMHIPSAQDLKSSFCLNRLNTRNLLFSAKSLYTDQKSVPQSCGIKPQPNMSLVQVGLDLLFDKRCLIMGFSAKPVSIAALQSTFLCRSADPSLGVKEG